jgi:hypothetical protein
MYNYDDELENILPESSTQLVSLNTRIPRFLSDRLDLSVGILQTNSRYQKVTKQTAVQILLEKGYEAILAEFEGMDIEEAREEMQVIRNSPELNSQQTYDMKAYAEFSNKTIYEPRKVSNTNNNTSPDSRVARFQQKLGLR